MSCFPIRALWITKLHCFITLALFCSISNGQRRDEDLSGLFPVVFNLATRARISSSATCGAIQPEVFCKLVDHIQIIPAENLHCDVCDARSNNPEQRHPIRNAVDGSQRWWQSPSLANGVEYNDVSITLDLGQIYQIAYLIVKAANSPRPGNWILERSLDGVNYKPWQYFAMGDQECRNVYGIEPTIGVPTSLTDDEVICTSRYSALNPLENGEIFVSLVNGRPGVFQPSPVLLDFTSAKFIRLRFQKIRTLHADLMSFSGIDTDKRDASVTRRYFYSIKDISIGGQCICYGHAAYCRRHVTETDRLQCQCLHNTAGDNCESCLPKFNQKPWQVGGIQNIGCEECNCHSKSDECVYNATVDATKQSLNIEGRFEGGGVCLNCNDYTTGINCEKCMAGYFRRPGMTPNMPRPCMKCQCVETATASSQCVPDDSQDTKGLRAGDCICKEGFTGRSCDKCDVGFFGYPRCRLCKCNAGGTINPEICDLPCSCKDNVDGSQCDRCKPGHFDLQRSNPFGCTECFCFGVSRSCKSVQWGLSKVVDVNGWVLSTLKPGGLTLLPRFFDGWLEAKTYLLRINQVDPRAYSQDDIHYWNTPMTYLGNRLSSYGGNLEFTLKYILDSNIRNQYHLGEPNVVLEGSNMSLTTNKEYLREIQENVVVIPLHEDAWYHLEDGNPATRGDLMNVLHNINRLLIRATYHTAQDTVYLKNVVLDSASMMVMDGSSLPSVEQCRCPAGYTGLSCESCSPGWRRVNNQLYRGRCEKCQCNSHASECDPYTGVCQDCKHSTTGINCDRCLPGFYGDPRYGTEDDCKPCACPLVSGNNFFAEKCVARPTPNNKENYECLNCQDGYTGVRCQECAPGYYGNPIIPGGFCRKCSCGGNIEQGIIGNCDKRTGVCILCGNNTEGEHCEKCRRGYYGSAVNGDCRPCKCSYKGSASSECNPRTGQCSCRGLFAGRKCDRCQPGFGDVAAGCKSCDCNRVGSTSTQCDSITGHCSCHPGVEGTNCNKCQKGYHGFSQAGCRACDCFGPGTKDSIGCDPASGRCLCKPNVNGKKCDSCKIHHFGLLSGDGCSSCTCDGIGSKNMQCAGDSGQCSCKRGVGGIRCNRCHPGYYGFSTSGCRRCKPCTQTGHVCDPITGQCACPPNTEGPNCEKCVTNCWGHNKNKGCKPCNCTRLGSVSQQCNLVTGQCSCATGHQGFSCDSCLPGYYNSSSCRPCGCQNTGVVADTCARGVCECDGIGQCFCKANVIGQQCDRCRPGTFSLDKANPNGCTECYCFFRGRSCRQAPYVWTPVDIPSQVADLVPNGTGAPVVDEYGYLVISDPTSSVPDAVSNKPVYWKLAHDLPDDLTTSYNGKLSFIHYFEGVNTLPMIPAPLVVIVGNGFTIETGSTNLESGNPLQFNIPLHEDAWTVPNRQAPIDRRLMMVVLQNVEAILVRATQDGKATYAEIASITLQTAVPSGPNVTSTLPAFGVELCDCPNRYSGESCQNPGEGYYRTKPKIPNNNIGAPETVIGDVRRCKCFGHSDKCDPETGACQECQHNTTGDKCDSCAPGFYGVATMGNPDDCKPCACPLEAPSNNFSPTCTGGKNGMMCTDCQEGYTGMTCDECAPGYYGDPKTLNDTCKPCGCNPDGSNNATSCDPSTGQCPCLTGISGLKCDECTDIDAGVVDGKCVSCYTGCTGILLDDLANMSIPSRISSLSNASFPWPTLYDKQSQVRELRDKMATLEVIGIQEVKELKDQTQRLSDFADKHLKWGGECSNSTKVTTSESEACKIKDKTEELLKKAKDLENEVNKTFTDIKEMIQGLDELVNRLLYNHTGVNMTKSLEEAKKLMEDIENRNFTKNDDRTKMENKLAEELSDIITALALKANISTSQLGPVLNDTINRLEDIVDIANTTDASSKEALDKIDELRKLLIQLKSHQDEIEKILQDAKDIIGDDEKTIGDAAHNMAMIQQQEPYLNMLVTKLSERIKEYNDSMEEYKDKMEDAIDHVLDLKARAADLEKLFAKTRNISGDAVEAAKAYKSIVDAIKEANKSANTAMKNAQESVNIAKVSDLEKEVEALMNKSREQLQQSNDLLKNATGLTSFVDDVKKNLTEAENGHKKVKDTAKELKKKMSQLPKELDKSLKKINETNEDTMDKIDEALDLVDKFNSSMADKVKEIKKFDIPGFNFDIGSEVARAKGGKGDADDVIDLEKDVEAKAQAASRKALKISADLTRLKEKIRDARSRVNDMKMSLEGNGQCHRSYRSPLSPSSTNEIRFGFKLNDSSSDMLMVLLQQSPQEGGKEFLAAEVRGNNVKFTWNSGKGQGTVSHPQVLEKEKWYQVIAKRVGSVGQLKVWDMDQTTEKKAKQEMSSQGAGCSLMNLNEESTIMLAGASDLSAIPPGITRTKFIGCMGSVSLDTNKIGVYNFKTNEPQHCGACKRIPEINLGSSSVYVFSGYGFAQFAVGSYNNRKTKVGLEFKTFYEDSQLFFVGNPDLGDFCSIELSGGHVRVLFYMGSMSFAMGETKSIYNNNQWTTIIFERKDLEAVLVVNNEKVKLAAPPGANGLELSGAPMFFGGLPSKFRTAEFKNLVPTDLFYGCMRMLSVSNLPPSADTSTLVNVETRAGCRENGIHNVAFRGEGYLILQNSKIKFSEQKNDISITFVTKKPNGVLLIARDHPGQNYYSIAMVDGRLEARMKSDSTSPVILESRKTFNDGKLHCVSLIKDGRTTDLVIDDDTVASGDARDISDLEDLYLGGLPLDAGDMTPTNDKLDGCISDVIVNGLLLSMGDAKQYKRADVGRCAFTDKYPEAALASSIQTTPAPAIATTTPPQECAAAIATDLDASALSVANNGLFFVEISTKIKRRDLVKDLKLSIDIRTFYPDGLIAYILNDFKDKYLGIQLKNGQIQVKHNYKSKPLEVNAKTTSRIDDGQWHTIQVEKVNEALSVTVDKGQPSILKVPKKLDIQLPLFIGGPHDPALFLSKSIDMVMTSIRGCIRNLVVKDKPLNLDDHTIVGDKGPCYKTVEKGVSFGGDAFGTLRDPFEILPRFEIQLQFRSTKKDGVLISTSSWDGKSGLSLELHEGKVKLSLLQDSKITTVASPNSDQYDYCDDSWHEVVASLDKDKLALNVDLTSLETAPVSGGIQQVKVDEPLTIGGFASGKSKSSLTQDSFNGCVGYVLLNNKPVDWYGDIDKFKNIRRSSCPA